MSLGLPSGAPSPFDLLRRTELDSQVRFSKIHGSLSLARRLKATGILDAHSGCVNRISFSPDATLLASVSDDACVCVWDVLSHRLRARVPTGHRANVFGVRFMPQTGMSKVATGGFDKDIRITDVEESRKSRVFRCHDDRVKTVEVDQTAPSSVISASEDGTVRLLDIRESASAPDQRRSASGAGVLVRIPDPEGAVDSRGIKSACLNPVDPTKLLVSGDSVRLFDRRKLSSTVSSPSGPDDAVLEFLPGHMKASSPERESRAASGGVQVLSTYAAFSEDGAQVVATFYADAVYVFDAARESSIGVKSFRPQSLRGGSASATRVQRLLSSALDSVENGAYSDAICTLNDVLSIDRVSVVALHMRCECYLMRGWVADHRLALADAEALRRELSHCPAGLNYIVSASFLSGSVPYVGDGQSRDRFSRLWQAVLELQRAEAIVGIVIPRGRILVESRSNASSREVEQLQKICSRLAFAVSVVDRLEHEVLTLLGYRSGNCAKLNNVPKSREVEAASIPGGMRTFYSTCLRHLTMRMSAIQSKYNSVCLELRCSRPVQPCDSSQGIPSGSRNPDRHATSAMGPPSGSDMRDIVASPRPTSADPRQGSRRDSSASRSREGPVDERGEFTRGGGCGGDLESTTVSPENHRGSASFSEFDVDGHENSNYEDRDAGDLGRRRRRRGSGLQVGADVRELTKRPRSGPGSVEGVEQNDSRDSEDEEDEEDDPDLVGVGVGIAPDYFWGDRQADLLGYKRQFVGHFNAHTDIKEASFYGSQCVLSGSDDGCVYVWEIATGRLVRVLTAYRLAAWPPNVLKCEFAS